MTTLRQRALASPTGAERDRRDDASDERYHELCAQIELEWQHEYESQFSPEFLSKYPFNATGVHEEAIKRMQAEA